VFVINLGSQDTFHRQNVDLLYETESWLDLGTKQLGTDNIGNLLDFASLAAECALESHVAGRSLSNEEKLVIARFEQTVLEVGSNVDVGLTIPDMRYR